MKNQGTKHKPRIRSLVWIDDRSVAASSNFLLVVACGLILAVGIGWRMYKVDQSGITHDETQTTFRYSRNPHEALTRYDMANNHLINSLCIYYTGRLFSGYEHYIRIPAFCMGVLYVLSAACIAFQTIRSRLILVGGVALLVFHYFVLDYCILGRGYAFALGAIYLEIAFLIRLIRKQIAFKFWWFPVIVISFLNFVTFGSMLSSVLMLTGINLVFVLFFSPRIYKEQVSPLKAILLNGISIPLLSGLLSYLLYRGVMSQISHTLKTDPSRGAPFSRYMYDLLIVRIFHLPRPLGYILLTLFIALTVFKLLFLIGHWLRFPPRRWSALKPNLADPAVLIYLTTGITVAIFFVYNMILRKPLAYPRNQVFFMPLVFLCAAAAFDRLAERLQRPLLKGAVVTATLFLLGAAAWHNFPKTHYATGPQTLSGPLLRQLKTIDPDRTWKIWIHKNVNVGTMKVAFMYYQQYGYRFEITPSQFDVFVCRTPDCPEGAALLDADFYDQFGSRIVVTQQFPTNKIQVDFKIKK